MRILDRYIIRQFLINFVILMLVIMLLFVMVDLLFDLDEFLEAGRVRAAEHGGSVLLWTLWSIGDYYVPVLLFIYVYLSGLLVVAAMGFTFSALSRSGELNTMVTSGISMFRIGAPVLVIGCLLNGLTLLDHEFLIPRFAPKLARRKSQVKFDEIRTFAVQYAHDGKGNLISAVSFDAARGELVSMTVLERDAKGMATRRISATQAHWNGKDRWTLIDGYAIRPISQRLDAAIEDGPQPVDSFVTDLSPQVLMARRAAIYPALLSMNELGGLLENPASNAPHILRIMHSRFSMMVLNVLILVISLPFFLTREPVSPLAQAVKSAAAGTTLWMLGVALLSTGVGGINPVVAAWLPVVIYIPLSAWMLQRMKT